MGEKGGVLGNPKGAYSFVDTQQQCTIAVFVNPQTLFRQHEGRNYCASVTEMPASVVCDAYNAALHAAPFAGPAPVKSQVGEMRRCLGF